MTKEDLKTFPKFGDIWKMGNHRLLCGDSTEKIMMDTFLRESKPKLCLTDPPYGINYTARSNKDDLYKLKVKNDHIVAWGDSFRHSQGPILYVWFSFKKYEVVARSLQDAGYNISQMVIWAKKHFSLQRHFYHLQHEQCMVCVKEGVKVTEHWTGDRKQTSVWNVPSVKPKARIHPTEKPVGIYTIPIINHTNRGEIVLDIFAGSGSLFEAAQQTKRRGYGVELCPETCRLILKRMANLGCEVSLESNIFD